MTPSQAAEGVSEERLADLAAFTISLANMLGFASGMSQPTQITLGKNVGSNLNDVVAALRELQHLRSLSTQNTEGWRPIDEIPHHDLDRTFWVAYTVKIPDGRTIRHARENCRINGNWIPKFHNEETPTEFMPLPAPPTLASRDVP